MTTPKQAYIWANARTPEHTALLVKDLFTFEAKACAAPVTGVWMYNEADVLGFFNRAYEASTYRRTVRTGKLLGLIVAKPGDTVTHWCDQNGKWFKLRYLGNINDKQLATAPATMEILELGN